MKIFSTIATIAVAQEQFPHQQNSEYADFQPTAGRTEFGATFSETMEEGTRVKEVEFSSSRLFSTWADRYDFIKDLPRVHDIAEKQIADGTYAKCQTRHGGAGEHALDFAPVLVGSASPEN